MARRLRAAACWSSRTRRSTGIAFGISFTSLAYFIVRDGAIVRTVDRAKLSSCSVERIEIDDPYYAKKKAFWACPLHEVLEMGFGRAPDADPDLNFFLRALDGFTKPASAAKLAEPGGYLALSDAERGTPEAPAWEPIDRR